MEGRIGAPATGMNADFAVLNSNPLDHIQNSVHISRFVRHGKTIGWLSSAALEERRFPEKRARTGTWGWAASACLVQVCARKR